MEGAAAAEVAEVQMKEDENDEDVPPSTDATTTTARKDMTEETVDE